MSREALTFRLHVSLTLLVEVVSAVCNLRGKLPALLRAEKMLHVFLSVIVY